MIWYILVIAAPLWRLCECCSYDFAKVFHKLVCALYIDINICFKWLLIKYVSICLSYRQYLRNMFFLYAICMRFNKKSIWYFSDVVSWFWIFYSNIKFRRQQHPALRIFTYIHLEYHTNANYLRFGCVLR